MFTSSGKKYSLWEAVGSAMNPTQENDLPQLMEDTTESSNPAFEGGGLSLPCVHHTLAGHAKHRITKTGRDIIETKRHLATGQTCLATKF